MARNKFWLKLNVFICILALSLPAVFAGGAAGDKSDKKGRQQARADIPKDVEDQYERATEAAEILQQLTGTSTGIPEYLLDRAQGIAVFPDVLKAALGIGGTRGKGLIATRQAGTWGTPVFVELTGGSFGFQIGGEATDLVLVFMNRKGVDSLMDSKLKLGADASIAAGPVGRTAQAGTDVALDAEILSYSRTKGAFIGVSLDGAVVDFDDSANRDVYGSEGKELLAGRRQPSPVTQPFYAALRQHTPRSPR